MSIAPQFGGKISKEQKERFKKLDHFEKGKFTNYEPIELEINFNSMTEIAKGMINPNSNVRPKVPIEVEEFDVRQIQANLGEKVRVTWLGHSSILLEMDNKTILIDPVFSSYVGPHKLIGKKRFYERMPFNIEELEHIDVIIMSHDHYDHLDYETIVQLKSKANKIIVPLGVRNHFEKWGFPKENIINLDWWEEIQLGTLKLVCTPSRHSSGRGVNDQSSTLWCSWCFLGENQKIFFSGDGGYGTHFKKIGSKYGSFDFGLIECGQYDELWADVHMLPEESVQAGIDVQATTIMPIHWAAFALANHDWRDPARRFIEKATELNIEYATPKIGESIILPAKSLPQSKWWEEEEYI